MDVLHAEVWREFNGHAVTYSEQLEAGLWLLVERKLARKRRAQAEYHFRKHGSRRVIVKPPRIKPPRRPKALPQAEQRRRLVEAGLCRMCRMPSPGKARCPACAAKHRAAAKASYVARMTAQSAADHTTARATTTTGQGVSQ